MASKSTAQKIMESTLQAAGITAAGIVIGAVIDKGIEEMTGRRSHTFLAAGSVVAAILNGAIGLKDSANEIDEALD